jgi:hypothetical protein
MLDPGSLFLILRGHLDTSGKASLSLPVPDEPLYVGATVYAQAIVASPKLKLTNLEVISLTDY